MCGRYLSLTSPDELAERFKVHRNRLDVTGPRYNVAPSTSVPAVLEHDGERRLGPLRWGFVPHWAKQLKGTPQPINARVETVGSNRMFATAFTRHRCILPADGFYEWFDRGEGKRKQPYHIADPAGEPLAFAAIWSIWRDPQQEDAEPLSTAAILTTSAQGEMARIHERMPLILPASLWDEWLAADEAGSPHLLETVQALGPPRLTATAITERVNNVRNEGPDLLEPGTVD